MNYKIEDFNLTIDTGFEIFDKLEKSGVKKRTFTDLNHQEMKILTNILKEYVSI